METLDNSAAPNEHAGTLLTAQVFADLRPASSDYAIAPEDQSLADEIASFSLNDVPTSVMIRGPLKLPDRIVADALPPQHRDRIRAELATAHPDHRDALEDRLVLEAVRAIRGDQMVDSSFGAGTPDLYQQERLAVAGELRRLDDRLAAITASLLEVSRSDTEYDDRNNAIIDPETGKPKLKHTYRHTGHARHVLELESAEIVRKIASIDGPEGQLRLKRALFEEVERRKAIHEQLEDHAEIERRAVALNREDRIERLARQRARIKAAEV